MILNLGNGANTIVYCYCFRIFTRFQNSSHFELRAASVANDCVGYVYELTLTRNLISL